MELSCRPQFSPFLFTPSTPSNHLSIGKKEARCLSSSSFVHPLCADIGLLVGSSPANERPSKTCCLPVGHFHSRRRYTSASWCAFYSKEKLNGWRHFSKQTKLVRRPRYIVARSEIAGTGYPDAAHQLPGSSGDFNSLFILVSKLIVLTCGYFIILRVSAELQLVSKLRGVCFYAVTSSVAIILFMLMMVAHPFVLLFDRYRRKAHHHIAKIWALLTVIPLLKVDVKGSENLPSSDTPAVYVSNHQSFLDIYTLLTLGRSFKFISKTSIFFFPVVGWAMFLLGAIPLKRMDSRSQLQALKRCLDLVKKGGSVFYFPEGTRSKDGKLGAFKKGAFSIAAKTGVPVVPITLIGTGKIMPVGMESRLYPGSVKVVIHKPINGSNTEQLCNEARNIIADALVREG